MRPLSIDIYKGMKGKWGAIQFAPQRPHFVCTDSNCRSRHFNARHDEPCSKCGKPLKPAKGTMFMEITSANGQNQYDWDNTPFQRSIFHSTKNKHSSYIINCKCYCHT